MLRNSLWVIVGMDARVEKMEPTFPAFEGLTGSPHLLKQNSSTLVCRSHGYSCCSAGMCLVLGAAVALTTTKVFSDLILNGRVSCSPDLKTV